MHALWYRLGFTHVPTASHHSYIIERQRSTLREITESIGESLRVERIGPGELSTYDKDGPMFVNVNTPHDYERAKEDLMGRVPGSREMSGDPITDTAT